MTQPKLINGPADRAPIERDSFLDSRVAVFIVTLPKGMGPEAARVFKQEVSTSLDVICRDAQMTIDSLKLDKCLCPMNERVYCHLDNCVGGSELDTEAL